MAAWLICFLLYPAVTRNSVRMEVWFVLMLWRWHMEKPPTCST